MKAFVRSFVPATALAFAVVVASASAEHVTSDMLRGKVNKTPFARRMAELAWEDSSSSMPESMSMSVEYAEYYVASKAGKSTTSKAAKAAKSTKSSKSVTTTTTSTTTPTTPSGPTLAIEALDPTVITGGIPDTSYDFKLVSENIPVGVAEVRFQWLPGLGAGGSETVAVVDGKAETTIQLSYSTPGPYTIQASLFDDLDAELANDSLEILIEGTVLTIDPPGLTDGEVDVEYTFSFVASNIPAGVNNVKFKWSFGVGAGGTGESADLVVIGGSADTSASNTYTANGAFGLVVEVQDASNDQVLAVNTVNVRVGPVVDRNFTLPSCDDWLPANSGGQGTFVDTWDILPAIPPDALIDFEFDALYVPDKFIFEYPVGNLVLDTGWRGSSSYNGDALYPGGVISQTDFPGKNPGYGQELGLITRLLNEDELQVTVVGPSPNTGWNYRIRCRIPGIAPILPESGSGIIDVGTDMEVVEEIGGGEGI